jgi:miniconductance mechanosensitive channel
MYNDWIYDRLLALNLGKEMAELLSLVITVVIIFILVAIFTLVIRRALFNAGIKWIKNNKYQWDEPLVDNRLLYRLSWFVPVLILHLSIDSLLPADSGTYIFLKRMMKVLFVIVAVLSLSALLSAINDIYRIFRKKRPELLKGFVDAGKIAVYALGGIFIVSIISGTSPWGIISVLGGLTAITMLVFKDTILGFAASIQLSSIDMIRVGDWIEMPSYGADGDVISMSIHTVMVQNWDKTITTIPTYALVSNSFKNWRGMSESGGRRIKRSIIIDINTISFCSLELLEKFRNYQLLSDYLDKKDREITTYNAKIKEDGSKSPMNHRRQTNIGIFRAYVIAYLKSNPDLRDDMTFLVRQLAPTEQGLPLEIYVFSKEQRWAHYEAIQADIFDHLLAALPEFGLRAYQAPSGHDLQEFADSLYQKKQP